VSSLLIAFIVVGLEYEDVYCVSVVPVRFSTVPTGTNAKCVLEVGECVLEEDEEDDGCIIITTAITTITTTITAIIVNRIDLFSLGFGGVDEGMFC